MNTMTDMKTIPLPWYRHPLVWMLIAIPAASVIVGSITMWFAFTTKDGLVVDDYYKQGMAINQVLKRDEHATAYHLAGMLDVDVTQGLARLDLDRGSLADYPDSLQLALRHATRGDSDVSIELIHGLDGQYIGYLKQALPAGAWYIEVGNDDWRLNARSRLEDMASVKLVTVDKLN